MLLSLAVQAVKKAPKDGEGVKSGPLGLAVILLLCVAVYFLFKSMSKHMKRVREGFPTPGSTKAPTTASAAETLARPGDSSQPADPAPTASAPPLPDPE